ncbi:unnamed protein product [Closterium sp. Yama58-4]|nr:unnamed protein product [Closterium sp. Yama58-4]
MLGTITSFDTKRRNRRGKQGLAASSVTETTVVPIKYHGGRVLSGATLNVYIIYYGTWPAKAGQNIIENFISSMSLGSANKQGAAGDPKVSYWWATNTKYYSEAENETKSFVSTKNCGGFHEIKSPSFPFPPTPHTPPPPLPPPLPAAFPSTVVRSKIGPKKPFPYDANGIYLILASKNVKSDGFCTENCGFHSMGYLQPTSASDRQGVAFSLLVNPDGCQDCMAYLKGNPTPNGNPGIDSMIFSIANSMAGPATNPDEFGWFDADRYESVGKCLALPDAFEPLLPAKNAKGQYFEYNVVGLKNMKFMVPKTWDLSTNTCVMQTIIT